MEIDKYKNIIMGWFKSWFDSNYRSGVPHIPPHRHNSIDNLPIKITDTIGNLPSNRVTGLTTGGNPGGANTQVQFNDNGTFGGDSGLVYDKTIQTLGVATIEASIDPNLGEDLTIAADYGGNIQIGTVDTVANGNTGDIDILSLDDTGDTGSLSMSSGSVTDTGDSGSITLETGYSADGDTGGLYFSTGSSSNKFSGDISIQAGYGGTGGGYIGISGGGGGIGISDTNATINIRSGYGTTVGTLIGNTTIETSDVYNSGTSGDVIIQTGNTNDFAGSIGNITIQTPINNSVVNGIITISRGEDTPDISSRLTLDDDGNGQPRATLSAQTDVYILSNKMITLGQINEYGNGALVLLQDRSVDPGTPIGGGYLYTKAGALYFKGSSATITNIAPA